MNAEVQQAALDLVKRAKRQGHCGKVADVQSMLDVVRDTKRRIPDWFIELFTTIPLCGLEFGWQAFEADDDFDGIAWMEWCDADGIRSESLDCYPGLPILERGYVNVAGDSGGGGDPYFVPTDLGDDPPLFQIYHDISEHADSILKNGRQLVAKSLSSFFREAIVAPRS